MLIVTKRGAENAIHVIVINKTFLFPYVVQV